MSHRMSLTRADDTPNLPAIKPSEGELFRTVPELAWTADGEKHPLERHLELLAGGACWVAETDGGSVVGFPSAEVSGDALHIWELADLLNYQNGGIGRALLAAAIGFAHENCLWSTTLSTFRGALWKEPIYRRLGFKTLQRSDCDRRLSEVRHSESAAGLPGERRCAMRLRIGATGAA